MEPERKNNGKNALDPENTGLTVKMNKRGLKRGSVAVLLTILFVTLMAALSAIYEAADRKAAVSMAEAAFEIAGRSVLSCYDKELHDRYSLFAFEADERTVEKRLKELDDLLMIPENASDMTLVTEYTSTKKALDEEVERWEELSEKLEEINQL